MAWIKSFLHWGKVLFCAPKENQKSARYFRGAGSDGLRYPASTSCLGRHSCPADRGPNSSSLYPPQAVVVAVAHFLCFSYLRLRRRFHASAGRYRQQRGNTSCEAANRRNEKKALSAATSFFPFRQLLRGLKGASSPFLVDPARRNRWWFSGSLLTAKENN